MRGERMWEGSRPDPNFKVPSQHAPGMTGKPQSGLLVPSNFQTHKAEL